MKTVRAMLFLFLTLFMMVPIVFSQPGPKKTTISGTVTLDRKYFEPPYADGDIAIALRSAKDPSPPAANHMLLSKDSCWNKPDGCPFISNLALMVGTYTLSIEFHDKVYRDTGGREGCCRILGYYYKDPATARDLHDYKSATQLSISAKKRSFSNIKIMVP